VYTASSLALLDPPEGESHDCLIKPVLLASGVESGGRETGLGRRGGQGRRKERQTE